MKRVKTKQKPGDVTFSKMYKVKDCDMSHVLTGIYIMSATQKLLISHF